MDQITENVVNFLIKLVNKHPFLKDRDFYVTGESYAGHYIPAISHSLAFERNEDV